MANMMCPAHKTSNEKSRKGWEQTFGKKKQTQEELELLCNECKPDSSDESRIRNAEVQELAENEKLIKKFLKHSRELGW